MIPGPFISTARYQAQRARADAAEARATRLERSMGCLLERAQADRDEAIAAHGRADNELQRQYYQGVAGALDGILRDCGQAEA